jgi:hypothetical protein
MGLAAGLVGSAAIGGVASLGSGLLQSGAASSAAQEQGQAATNNLEFQSNLLGLNEENLAPFIGQGTKAGSTLSSLLTPGASQTSTLEQLPGFQFASKWGTKSTQNALSAEGLGGSTGPLAQGISNFNNGLASTDFSQFAGLLQNETNSGINATEGLTGATNTAAAQGGSALTAAGNAAASGTLGSANALSSALGSTGSSASNALLLSQLLGSGGGSGGIFGNLSSSVFNGA